MSNLQTLVAATGFWFWQSIYLKQAPVIQPSQKKWRQTTTNINDSQTCALWHIKPSFLKAQEGRKTGNYSKVKQKTKKTQQSKGTMVLTSTPKSQQATRRARHKACQLFFFFFKPVWVFIIPNRVLLPTGPRDGCMLCPGWGRENSRGFFHGFMGPYFMGISYSVVQVIFKAASHPLIPLSSPHLTIGWKRFS